MTGSRHDATKNWTCSQVRDQIEVWALGALDDDEMAAMERHIAVCDDCRREATRLGGVVSLLPFSLAPVSPSAEARTSLMARIADEQMAVAAAQTQVRTLPAAPTPSAPVETRRRFHWSQVLLAPLAIALLVMTLWSFELREQANESGSGSGTSALTTAMLPDGFQTFTLRSDCEKCQSTGTMLADPEKADALMVAWGLDPSQVHQVWCEEGDGSQAMVASLNVSDSGEVVQPLVFDQPIAGYSRIYVVNNDGEIVEINMEADNRRLSSPSPEPAEKR